MILLSPYLLRIKRLRFGNTVQKTEAFLWTKIKENINGGTSRSSLLNHLNKKLINENVSYRKEISSANLRAERAEEKASELENRVRQGAVLRARDINMVCLNARDKEVTRVKTATTLRVDFAISSNELAAPGNREVYMVIKSPDGYLLSTDSMPTFNFHGSKKGYSASREIDYQNDDLDVGLFYNGDGITAGKYSIEVYMDGIQIGSTATILR